MEGTTIKITASSHQSLDYNFHITTPRLYISHLNPSSDAHINLFHSLPRPAASLKSHPPGPNKEADLRTIRQIMLTSEERLIKTGWGRFIISLKPSNDTQSLTTTVDETRFEDRAKSLVSIGAVSMQQDRFPAVPGPQIPDVGFSILAEYQGKGYAREAARGLMQWFRENKQIMQFAGITEAQNAAARRVLERLGFTDRGVRWITGVVDGGKATELNVWTLGVGGGEEELREVGL